MEKRINIVIVHYNTPLLTECLIKSINKFTPNSNIFIFDNSDKYPFDYRQDNITYCDNTKGQIINFKEWLSNYPDKTKSTEATKSFGSAKHCVSIQKCIDLLDENFILLDSDVLLKRDISDIFDERYMYVAETVQQPLTDIQRVLPYICFLNVRKMKKCNVTFFNENFMHGLFLSKKGDMYDTGAWFYKACEGFTSRAILCEDYIYHYKAGSWNEVSNKRYGKTRTQYEWLAMHTECFTSSFDCYKEDLIAAGIKHWQCLNLDEPKTIQDKINWLKLYDTTPLKTMCADKIKVHKYCEDKLGKDICIPILKVYDKPEDINWNKLPNKFVLKCNHGSGMNIVVKNKYGINRKETIEQLKRWMETDYAFENGYEMQYHDIVRKVFAEEYKEDASQKDSLYDYKVWCFNGEPKFFTVNDGHGHGKWMRFYDMDMKLLSYKRLDYPGEPENEVKLPSNIETMKEYARKLSEDFRFVRVDFYEINGELFLGEMTFTPASGYIKYKNSQHGKTIGNMLSLKNRNVIYTCITGNYEPLDDPFSVSPGFDYICFTNSDTIKSNVWKILPIPKELDGLTEVKKQRCIKINAHKYLPQYDLSIWVDGSIKLLKNVNQFIKDNCEDGIIFIPSHPQRNCIYEEMATCIKMKKDTEANIAPQRKRYKEEKFPEHYGLVQSNIIVRKHNDPDCIRLMECWWNELKNGSHRDQLSFNYAVWKNEDVKVNYLSSKTCSSEYFKWDTSHGKKKLKFQVKEEQPSKRRKSGINIDEIMQSHYVLKGRSKPSQTSNKIAEIKTKNPVLRRHLISKSIKTFLNPNTF